MQKEYYELLKVGLTEGEAKVYLALSELGSSTVGPVVKKSGVAYSNIYDILERLMKKGVVSFVVKAKTKYFQAASANNLLEYLNRREKEIVHQREQLKKILVDIEKLQESGEKQEAEVFMGVKGLRTAYEKLFNRKVKGKDYLFFYIHKGPYAEKSDDFYNTIFHLVEKFTVKGIANRAWKDSWFYKKVKKETRWKMKFVDFPIPSNIDVYSEMVLFVSWDPTPVGILVHSNEIAQNFRDYFYEVWKQAK